MTATPVDGSAKTPPAKSAAARTKSTAAKPKNAAAKSTAAPGAPKTAAAKTLAEKAAAVKSVDAKAAAAKTTAARTTAAKAAAAKSAAARSAATKTATKTAAAKAAAAKAAAAKTAATKAAATKAADKAAAEAKAADEEAAETARAAVDADVKETSPAVTDEPDATAPEASPRTSATKRTTTNKTTPTKPRTTKPRTTKPRTTKTRGAGSSTRPKPVVAADAAAPTSETVASPAAEIEPPAQDAVAEDVLFTELIAAESAEAESAAGPEAAQSIAESAETEPVAESAPDIDTSDAAAAAAADDAPGDLEVIPAPADDTITGPAFAQHAVILRDLVKDFGDQRAVNGIDLTVPAGSFYGIVGPNGAGKTTTLSILAGLLRATSGQVVVCGIDQAEDALGAKRLMGVLPDRLRTFDRLTGRQLLHYYGLLRGLASDVIDKRTADLARAFDLADALNRVVSDYSAGMTKKIMLAGAMIHSPRVLVLDEPFEAVDPVSSAVILDILRAYVAHGGTVILSSHGMDLVERVCSRVAIIVGGDVLAEGTIDEVRAGQSLEARFVELSGGIGEVEGLEWLHTFSD